MRNALGRLLVLVLLLPMTALPSWADETAAPDPGLLMDLTLSEESLQKLADGTASQGESRLESAITAPPAAEAAPVSAWKFWAGGAALLVLGFVTGLLLRGRSEEAGQSDAPVRQWLDAEKLQEQLEERDEQLRQQLAAVEELTADRENLVFQHTTDLEELQAEKDALSRELHALRLRSEEPVSDEAQQTIDALRAEIERLKGADDLEAQHHDLAPAVNDIDELRKRALQQDVHIEELERLLHAVQKENDAYSEAVVGKEAQVEALEDTLAHRDEELERAHAELATLREKAEQLDEKENRASMLDEELAGLREEMNELLGKTGQYQVLVPELETRLFHHQEQIGALESDLAATAEEVEQRERTAQQWKAQVDALQESLANAENNGACLKSDLEELRRQNELLKRNPTEEELHHENTRLRGDLEETASQLQAATARLDQLQLHQERVDEWNSTIATLKADIRRKSTLVDSQADHLAKRETEIEALQTEIEDLRALLAQRSDETESLRKLLEEAGNVVVSLRDEISDEEHAQTRLRLARDPAQDPFGDHEDAIDPVEADIEALRFTARSRRDLGNSLETILAEERNALEQAKRRVGDRDEELVALKNEISANRVAMVALQNRLSDFSGDDNVQPMEPGRVERELHQSMKVLESLRADLHKWRGRVKPLHEALVARNERIQSLEAEVAALRQAQGFDPVSDDDRDDEVVEDVVALLDRTQNGESAEAERARCLNEMKYQWDRIVSLETELADTGARLARLLELDDARCRQIESLEMARAAQVARLAELNDELAAHGVDAGLIRETQEAQDNVVDLGARRPS